nr:uncharacterized protein LOC111967040 isoform X2 [Salvelinus alpinus]
MSSARPASYSGSGDRRHIPAVGNLSGPALCLSCTNGGKLSAASGLSVTMIAARPPSLCLRSSLVHRSALEPALPHGLWCSAHTGHPEPTQLLQAAEAAGGVPEAEPQSHR